MDLEGRVRPAGDRKLFSKPGKRARVISIEQGVPLTTRGNEYSSRGAVLGCEKASSKDNEMPSSAGFTIELEDELLPTDVNSKPDTTMYPAQAESHIVDLYCMESNDEETRTIPFQYMVKLHRPWGEIVRLNGTFDDGAMVNTVDLQAFQTVKHHLKTLEKSNCIMHMADGRLVPSAGAWTGSITAEEVSHTGTFKVFNSNRAWSVLFGKPLLKKFKAVHNYDLDIIKIPNGNNWVVLQNQHQPKGRTQPLPPANGNPSNNQHTNLKGDHCMSPTRQVSHNKQSSEPVDVAVSQTAQPITGSQDVKEHIN
jgi:hypothetical protein